MHYLSSKYLSSKFFLIGILSKTHLSKSFGYLQHSLQHQNVMLLVSHLILQFLQYYIYFYILFDFLITIFQHHFPFLNFHYIIN